MADPYVRVLGHVVAMDESLAVVGVDYDAVVINADSAALSQPQAEEFARLFNAACWEAGRNGKRMTDETPSTPLTGSSRKIGREWCRVRPGVQARLVSYGGQSEDAFAWVEVRERADG